MSEKMSKDMSEDMSERMSEDLSERMSDRMSEDLSGRKSERMSKDMSERMSGSWQQDVRKNVRKYVCQVEGNRKQCRWYPDMFWHVWCTKMILVVHCNVFVMFDLCRCCHKLFTLLQEVCCHV